MKIPMELPPMEVVVFFALVVFALILVGFIIGFTAGYDWCYKTKQKRGRRGFRANH